MNKYIHQDGNKWRLRIKKKNLKHSSNHDTLQQALQQRDELLGQVYEENFNIELPKIHHLKDYNEVTDEFKFGVLGDTHLCSNYQRLELIEAMYDIWERDGVQKVFHTGNWIDGESRFNKTDIFVHGMDNQIDYFIENYPTRQNIKTYVIDGDDHEGWYNQKIQVDIGLRMEQSAKDFGRKDLISLGYMEQDVKVKLDNEDVIIRVMHGGGGSAKTVSHAGQKIVDNLDIGERPDIMLIGHYHKTHFLPDYDGVYVFQTGCLCEQTPFMRKKNLKAKLGAYTITLKKTEENIRVVAEYIPFKNNPWTYRRKPVVI